MSGGLGSDTYYVDNARDSVVETSASGGTNTVNSSVSHVLAANVERLTLIGTAAINGTGNALVNVLTGNGAANVLNGEAGADKMSGLIGDDIYYVDDDGDVVVEIAAEGKDTVFTTLSSLTLSSDVEDLVFHGSGDFAGTGNELDNLISRFGGNDVLAGAGGNDTMSGLMGHDAYYVDAVGDVVIEKAGEGRDAIFTTLSSLTLGSNVEDLVFHGSGDFAGTGNGLDNLLWGSGGNDIFDGVGGADEMNGSAGDDIYYVGDVGDIVGERVAEGKDLVFTTLSALTLGSNVEDLVFHGSGDFTGTGNELDNIISGAGGDDVLDGGSGADLLEGELGNDMLSGGAGVDRFAFDSVLDKATNMDTILDFATGEDLIFLSRSVFAELAEGVLSADAFHAGTAAHDADDRIIYDAATGSIHYDADGTGSAAELVLFATVTPGRALTNADLSAF